MCSTVVKQDTASRDISRGNISSNPNSEPIMIQSTVDDTGSNKEMTVISSTVVKKDTASREECRRSRRSNNKLETITKRSTVVKIKTWEREDSNTFTSHAKHQRAKKFATRTMHL